MLGPLRGTLVAMTWILFEHNCFLFYVLFLICYLCNLLKVLNFLVEGAFPLFIALHNLD